MHRLVSFRVQKNVRKAVVFLASTEDWQVPGRYRQMPAGVANAWPLQMRWEPANAWQIPTDAPMEWQMPGPRQMRWEPANVLLFCESVQHFFVDCKTFFNFFVADCKRRQKADNIRTCNRS